MYNKDINMRQLYSEITRRKSFHTYGEIGSITKEELNEIERYMDTIIPLDPDIKIMTRIVPVNETNHKDGEYALLFYSEKKGDYLRNIGYFGEQIDLYLSIMNIGALWCGTSRPKCPAPDGYEYVIMIIMSKVPPESFRKDTSKFNRKAAAEIWQGKTLGIADVVRFAPSACNSQPWFVKNGGDTLSVYRKKPARFSIMSTAKADYFNRIDIGIFLCILEICMGHAGVKFVRDSMPEREENDMMLNAEYKLS